MKLKCYRLYNHNRNNHHFDNKPLNNIIVTLEPEINIQIKRPWISLVINNTSVNILYENLVHACSFTCTCKMSLKSF